MYTIELLRTPSQGVRPYQTKGYSLVSKKKTAKKVASKTSARTKAATKKAPAKKATAKKAAARTKSKVSSIAKPGGLQGPGQMVEPYSTTSGEEYMNENQQEHFRNILAVWKRQLMEEVDRTVHHMKDEAANFPDPNDRATQESEFSLELRTRDRERKLIKKIDEALLTVESGDYGYCEACGIEIGIRRLEARPTATLCIDCKTLDEIREKQMGG